MTPRRVIMNRAAASAAAVLVTFAGSAVLAQSGGQTLPSAWAHWRVYAPVRVDASDAGGFVSVVPPPGIAAAAQRDWSDVRVIDDTGREQPFVVRVRVGTSSIQWRTARVFDPGYVPGQYSQATIDLGAAAGVHNRLRIVLAPIADDFMTWMDVSVSDDAKSWAIVRERVPIFQLSHAGVGSSLETSYPDSLKRYVRVRILDGSRRYDVAGAAVAQEVSSARELVDAPITFAPSSTASDRTVLVSSPASPGLAIGELRFESSDAAFDRAVAIEASDDNRVWSYVAGGSISRRMNQTAGPMVVRVSSAPTESAAYWRVTIYNGSDRALSDLRVHAMAIPRRLVFRAESGRQYRVIAGNARASTPSYDLARTVDAATLDAAHPAIVEPAAENAGYADPAPWTERHPWVLWAAAVLAVAAIGLLALRTMRGGPANG